MQEYQIDQALKFFKEIPYTEWDDFGIFDPFRATIRDCICLLYTSPSPRDS